MTKREKILRYMSKNGVDLTPYIDTVNYQRSGTIVINSKDMFGIGGRYRDWVSLLWILKRPNCPVKRHRIRGPHSAQSHPFRYLLNYDRLTWKE